MKKILLFIVVFKLHLLFLTIGCCQDSPSLFDYDTKWFDLGQIRSIVYHVYLGNDKKDHLDVNIVYFRSNDLDNALKVFYMSKKELMGVLREKVPTDVPVEILTKYMSKAALRIFVLYLQSSEGGLYKVKSGDSRAGERFGVAKYEYANGKLFAVEFSDPERKILEKYESKGMGMLGLTMKPTYYEKFHKKGDIVFEGPEVKWHVSGRKKYDISDYIFDAYEAKADDSYFKDVEYGVIEGIDYLCERISKYSKNEGKNTDIVEIFNPRLEFYWNVDIPGSLFSKENGHFYLNKKTSKISQENVAK